MRQKVCKKCKKEKSIEDFNKNKSRKDGLHSWCKICVSEYNKNYYENNKEQLLEYQKDYRENNKEQIAEYQKDYRDNNKEQIADHQKKYYENNKEQIADHQKKYYENNKEQIAEYQKDYRDNNKEQIAEYKKIKYHTDINYRLASSLRSRINRVIKPNQKQGSAVRDLGCSIQFFKEYLENQFHPDMNWNNYGDVWNIDHIIPLCAFDLTDRFQFRAACYYKNLQPLCVEENIQKGGKYQKEDYKRYLEYFATL